MEVHKVALILCLSCNPLSWFGSRPCLSQTTDITWLLIRLFPLTATYFFPLCRWMVSYWAFDMVNIGDKILKDPCRGLADWCLIFNLCSIAEHVSSRKWQPEVIYQHRCLKQQVWVWMCLFTSPSGVSYWSVWIRKEERSSKCGSNLCASSCSLGCLGVHDNSSVPLKLRKFCCV